MTDDREISWNHSKVRKWSPPVSHRGTEFIRRCLLQLTSQSRWWPSSYSLPLRKSFLQGMTQIGIINLKSHNSISKGWTLLYSLQQHQVFALASSILTLLHIKLFRMDVLLYLLTWGLTLSAYTQTEYNKLISYHVCPIGGCSVPRLPQLWGEYFGIHYVKGVTYCVFYLWRIWVLCQLFYFHMNTSPCVFIARYSFLLRLSKIVITINCVTSIIDLILLITLR